MWRSTLVPGWGQLHEGQKEKGFVYMGSAALLLANFISSHSKYTNAQRSYSSQPTLPFMFSENALLLNYLLVSPKREQLSSSYNQLNIAGYALGAFWMWNIMDAYFFKATPGGISLNIGIFPEREPVLTIEHNRPLVSKFHFELMYRF